ncbi:MAG: glycosyltransferase, partial [Bacteroidota bacterium]
ASNMCLIPHLKSVHTDNTIPHKLFQYMILEKPVVASNCNPIIRIIEETKAGLIYQSNNEADLAAKVISLYEDTKLRKEMGRKGKEAVLEKYNWDKASKNLISIYSEFENMVKDG